jgi:hypothetical protein
MSYKKEFEDILLELFNRRTHWLRDGLFTNKPGKPPVLSRKILDKKIREAQEVLSDAFAYHYAKYEFEKCVAKKKSWHIKGHGVELKRQNFLIWFNKEFECDNPKHFVYMFIGNNNRCIYVGRTNIGIARPSSQFRKHWIHKAKRIEIYLSNSYKDSPKLECLAIHFSIPLHNKNKAATKEWTSKCPLCHLHNSVEEDMRRIFT